MQSTQSAPARPVSVPPRVMRRRATSSSVRAAQPRTPVAAGTSNDAAPAVARAVYSTHGSASVQTVLDQQGSGRVTHQPDGSIVWEPLADGAEHTSSGSGGRLMSGLSLSERTRRRLLGLAEIAGAVSIAMGGAVAAAATLVHVDRAYKNGTSLTTSQLSAAVANTVSSAFAGLVGGLLLGPVRGVTQLVRASAKSVLAGLLIHRAATALRSRVGGARAAARGLRAREPGALMRTLASIVARALASEQFRRDFESCSGFKLLLKLIEDCVAAARDAAAGAAPGVLPPVLPRALAAADALMRAGGASSVDACVYAGGVPLLLSLLSPVAPPRTAAAAATPVNVAPTMMTGGDAPRPARTGTSSPASSAVSACDSSGGGGASGGASGASGGGGVCGDEAAAAALACLGHVAASASGCAAIRAADGVPVLVAALSRCTPTLSNSLRSSSSAGSASAATTVAARSAALLGSLASDADGKAALRDARALPALLRALGHESTAAPAASALASAVRGCAPNQDALSRAYGASAALRSVPTLRSAVSNTDNSAPSDVAALLTVLARFPPESPCHWPEPEGAATEEYEMVGTPV
ncbi:hypothetical protein FOA52_004649 [Chlamydomonas sp. UWO 241]|nr:hypothetical protein FOA52_004649 [Chlamydomonas sp. UWO 241]